nr:hypothetical protein [Nocardia farcinica]
MSAGLRGRASGSSNHITAALILARTVRGSGSMWCRARLPAAAASAYRSCATRARSSSRDAEAATTSLRTTSGWSAASCSATDPPEEMPSTSTGALNSVRSAAA